MEILLIISLLLNLFLAICGLYLSLKLKVYEEEDKKNSPKKENEEE